MNLRRIDESIPLGLRQLEFLMRIKRLLKCRANAFVRFFTIFGFVRGVIFVMMLKWGFLCGEKKRKRGGGGGVW